MKRALLTLLSLVACGRTPSIEAPLQPAQPEQPVQRQQPLEGCAGKRVVTLNQATHTLTLTGADGSKTLFTFGAGTKPDQVSVMQWDLQGGLIGGLAYVDRSWEYALLKPDGTVVFHKLAAEPHSPSMLMGADGSLAIGAATGFIVKPDGSVADLGALIPMTPLLPSGEVVVARGAPWEPATEKGIWKDGVFRPLPVALPAYSNVTVVGAHAVFIDGSSLVSALDGARIALPAAGLAIAQTAGGRYVLLSGETAAALVDLEQRTARALASVPKLQERYSWWNAGLEADGTVLAGSPRGEQLQLQGTADLGATWADVGQPMTMGMDFGLGRWIFALEKNHSVLALSMSTGYGHYVNELQLVSAAGAHRLSTGGIWVNADLSPGAVDLSSDGQCVASWVAPEQHDLGDPLTLVFMDAAGKQQTLTTSVDSGWLRFAP